MSVTCSTSTCHKTRKTTCIESVAQHERALTVRRYHLPARSMCFRCRTSKACLVMKYQPVRSPTTSLSHRHHRKKYSAANRLITTAGRIDEENADVLMHAGNRPVAHKSHKPATAEPDVRHRARLAHNSATCISKLKHLHLDYAIKLGSQHGRSSAIANGPYRCVLATQNSTAQASSSGIIRGRVSGVWQISAKP